jgi:hypothetical protein
MEKKIYFLVGIIIGMALMSHVQKPFYEKSVINDAVYMAVKAIIEQRQELGLCN